jgi:epoxyqueuosine reductase
LDNFHFAASCSFTGLVTAHLGSDSPLVRGMAVWAARQLVDEKSYRTLELTHMADERDPMVRAEWG